MVALPRIWLGDRRRFLKLFFFAGLLLAGCARLKQCAYQGVSRDEWQQPQKVITSMQIRPGAIVADLGAGGGYFTFKLASAAGPDGKVYAVDIDSGMVDLIANEARQRAAANVEAILGRPDDPCLPNTGVDLIFTSNTYHHIENRVAYFAGLRKYLRPGGRVAIIEYDRRSWIVGLLRHYTPSEFIKREMEQAGYTLSQEFDFLDRQSFLIFAAR
ncbi:MAG: class I SAM-dependent methyltransferase [Chloroflexota bacterium]